MDVGKIISITFDTYAKNAQQILKVLLFLYVLPLFVVDTVVYVLGMSSQERIVEIITTSTFMMNSLEQLAPYIAGFIVYALMAGIIYLISYISLFKIFRSIDTDASYSAKSLLNFSLTMVFSYIIMVTIELIAVGLASLLLIIPGIIIGIYWTFTAFALLEDGTGILEALGASYRLVKDNWWRVAGYLFVFGLIVSGIQIGLGVITFIFDMVMSFIPGGAIPSMLLDRIVAALVLPITVGLLHYTYWGLKSEKGAQKNQEVPVQQTATTQ